MRIVSFRTGKTRSLALAAPCASLWSASALSILAVVFFVVGCGGARPIKYYQLSYPTTAPPPSPDAINTTLMVRPFEASHLYLGDQIVYGFDSPEMGVYQTHRGAQPPVQMLQDALVRGLRSTGRFRAVYTIRAETGSQYILAGHLYDFKEVDGSTIVAQLNYAVRLRDRMTGTTVWTHLYTHDEPASEKSVAAVATAMDKNVQRSVQEVQAGLEDYFRANPPK